ncbi:MAG: cysteine synthase family protein [Treponema sp.]|nr:cysteine synthase family protein [Treponema sp.]
MGILDIVGNTALLELFAEQKPSRAGLFAKAEFLNPSGSVKDRAAKAMILEGIEQGKLTNGKTIIDATSGNTGIAYAMIGAALGYAVKIYLPANASMERKSIMRHYGAELVETSPLEGSDGAFLAVQEEVRAYPEKYFYPNQYNNDTNWRAHFNGTGVEIWEQTGGRISHFITSMGTSGTFMGTSRRLKGYNPRIRAIAIQPDSPFHGIEGTKHMESTLKPGFYDPAWPDDFVTVNTEDAYAMARRLAREEGVYTGVSSAANVLAALRLAETLPRDALVVTILCDSGTRYMSDRFWDEAAKPSGGNDD